VNVLGVYASKEVEMIKLLPGILILMLHSCFGWYGCCVDLVPEPHIKQGAISKEEPKRV